LIIDGTNNTPVTLRQAITNAGLKLKDSVDDHELQGVIDRQSGYINFSLDKDKITITGYKYVRSV
jgi:hypothetical protein